LTVRRRAVCYDSSAPEPPSIARALKTPHQLRKCLITLKIGCRQIGHAIDASTSC